MMKLTKYINGNCNISIDTDGTRTIEFDDSMRLEYPLNIDIRVSTKCQFGQRDDGSYVLCNFCHEEAKVNGEECDYELTEGLISFLIWCDTKGFICNLTINQGHIKRDVFKILKCIKLGLIKGLGISYRSGLPWSIPNELLEYENTVFHVIIGIDDISDIINLHGKGVRKILVLGEKDFGANKGNVDTNSLSHRQWRWHITKCIDKFDITSFDNLALEQLKLRRLFNDDSWNEFYQGEHSFYINAVDNTFSRSSRSEKSMIGIIIPLKNILN